MSLLNKQFWIQLLRWWLFLTFLIIAALFFLISAMFSLSPLSDKDFNSLLTGPVPLIAGSAAIFLFISLLIFKFFKPEE